MPVKVILIATSQMYRTYEDESHYVQLHAISENDKVTYKISTFRNGTLMGAARPDDIHTALNIYDDTETSLIESATKFMVRVNAQHAAVEQILSR